MNKLVYKQTAPDYAVAEIASRLNDYLGKGTVLLSLSGGSAILTEIRVLNQLTGSLNLTITLNDERYGKPGHPNSNWQQLLDAGLGAEFSDFQVLSGESASRETRRFNKFLKASADHFNYRISILGMGADGHTSGILPGSPAIKSNEQACQYLASDYLRISNTPLFLKRQTEAFVLAYGDSKHAQIEKLSSELPIAQQPIQIIKQIPRVTFYNDFKGVRT